MLLCAPLLLRAQDNDDFNRRLATSQKLAAAKYPDLAKAGSPLNSAFLAEYKILKEVRDSLIRDPTWPEKIADNCAENLGITKRPVPAVADGGNGSVLGGTLADAVAKYGPGQRQQPNPEALCQTSYVFYKSGFEVQVQFLQNKVAAITYRRPTPLNHDEIWELLKNNSQGESWRHRHLNSDERDQSLKQRSLDRYVRADGHTTAEYDELGSYNGLMIKAAAFNQASGKTVNLSGL